jgi:hypothetical protein
LSRRMKHGTVDFYAVVAQIIPLLLLVYLFQIRTRIPSRTVWKRARVVYALTNMCLVLAGEVAALVGLFRDAKVGVLLAALAWAGAGSMTLHLAYFITRRIVDPSWQKTSADP